MNWIDIVLIVLIASAVLLAIRRLLLNRGRGKDCSGRCERCAGCDTRNAL